MRAIALLALTCLASPAGADARKTAPSAYTKAARDAFARAVAAEDAGDLGEARSQYERAFEISPHAATAYNLAGVLDRQGQWDMAVETYELYLMLAPGAQDRAQVEALITARLQQKVPLVLEDQGENLQFDTAYILIDGVVVMRPGQAKVEREFREAVTKLAVPPGVHTIDVVTPITYASARYDVRLRDSNRVTMKAPTSIDGNVVISLAAFASEEDRQSVRIKPRPGTYVMNVNDGQFQCVPLSVEIPKAVKGVLFFHAAPTEQRLDSSAPVRCRKYTVKPQTLVFPP